MTEYMDLAGVCDVCVCVHACVYLNDNLRGHNFERESGGTGRVGATGVGVENI